VSADQVVKRFTGRLRNHSQSTSKLREYGVGRAVRNKPVNIASTSEWSL